MAQKLTSESANKEHNVGARIEAIKKLHRELLPIEKQIEDLKEEARELRQTFKADTGISMADFSAARRLAMIEDDDARRGKIDTFRECYNALMPGEQLNWLDAVDRADAKSNGSGELADA